MMPPPAPPVPVLPPVLVVPSPPVFCDDVVLVPLDEQLIHAPVSHIAASVAPNPRLAQASFMTTPPRSGE
jgi:hypothetical protein